jgi:hypothetical protein
LGYWERFSGWRMKFGVDSLMNRVKILKSFVQDKHAVIVPNLDLCSLELRTDVVCSKILRKASLVIVKFIHV